MTDTQSDPAMLAGIRGHGRTVKEFDMAKRTCSVDGCDAETEARGWCRKHYVRWSRTGSTAARNIAYDLPLTGRIAARVARRGPNECWLWTGPGRPNDGYATLSVEGSHKYVHRLVYELEFGAIPDGLQVDHACRNRRCCNPAHLRLATSKQNKENTGPRSGSQTGVRGVSFDQIRRKYRVQVCHFGQRIYGGRYATLAEAEAAAIALRNALFTHNALDRIA